MKKLRWLLAIPVVLAATLVAGPTAVEAATIRDRAGMFSKEAVREAQALLDKVERASGVPIVIETIDAIPGLEKSSSPAERSEAINALAVRRDKAIDDEGIYLLISKREHLISHVLVRERLAKVLPIGKRDAIRDAFVEEFKKGKGYDSGLLAGAKAIETALHGVTAHGRIPGGIERVQHRAEGGKPVAGRSSTIRHVPADHPRDIRRAVWFSG